MQTLSDSFLSSLSNWLQWIAIFGTGLGLLAAIGTFFVSAELSGRLERRLATAHSEAEQAKAIVEEVRLKQQPRSLSDEQRQKFATGLTAAAGTPDFAVAYTAGDKEAENFSKQLSAVLTDAGITHLSTWWSGDPLPAGVMILSRDKTSDPSASVISQAFIQAGIPSKYARGALIPDKNICIIVGAKP